jgi:type II secretory pathway pseudopilin PulG
MTHHNKGFTLVELVLSMAFLSMLLLAIALLVLQISSIYNKGLTLKSVNEAGQLISSDIQRTLNTSEPLFVQYVEGTDNSGGRLCAGSTVYAWNFGSDKNDDGFNTYSNGGKDVRMVKFTANETTADGPVEYCVEDGGSYPLIPNDATRLLADGKGNLALHTFTMNNESPTEFGLPVNGDATQRIYRMTMVIGTNEKSIRAATIRATGCEVPTSRVDDEYCAVNEFDFTARAGNRSGGEAS